MLTKLQTQKERAAAEAKFKLIGEAHRILPHPDKKARYDARADIDGEYAGDGMHGHGEIHGHDGKDQVFMNQQVGMGGHPFGDHPFGEGRQGFGNGGFQWMKFYQTAKIDCDL